MSPHSWGGGIFLPACGAVARKASEGQAPEGLVCLLGAVQRRADRPRPDAQLTAHDLDSLHVSDVDAALQLLPNGIEQHFARGCDSTADHDRVDADQHYDIARADPQVTAGVAQPLLCAVVAGPRGGHRLLHTRLPAGGGDGVGSSQRLEAAVVAAVASWPVGKDGLMAELTGGPFMAQVEVPAKDQPSAHPCAERDAQHRSRTATRAQGVLRQRERARVIDQAARVPDRMGHLAGDVHAVPITRNVGNETRHPRVGLEDAWHAYPNRLDAFDVAKDGSCNCKQLPHHALLAAGRVGRKPARFQKARFPVALDDRPLQIRPAHVKTEVTRHGAYSAADEPIDAWLRWSRFSARSSRTSLASPMLMTTCSFAAPPFPDRSSRTWTARSKRFPARLGAGCKRWSGRRR